MPRRRSREQRKRPGRIAVTVALVATTVALTTGASPGSDQTPEPSRFSLTISPARLVVPPRAGVVRETVTAHNTGEAGLDLRVVLSGFRQQPNGAIVFGRPGVTTKASWVSVRPDSFHLEAGEQQPVRLRIDVPRDAEPGDHSIGVVFLVPAETSADNVTVDRGIGTQLLVRAPGPVVRDVGITDLDLPGFSTGGQVDLTATVRNAGTVHEDFIAPENRIIAQAQGQRLPFPNATVLADTTRTLTTQWTDPPLLCHCRVTVALPNGHGGTSTVSASVWIFPLYQALGALLLILGSLLLISWRRNRQRAALAAARKQGYEEAIRQPA